jgi:hypothetical protein
LLKSKNTTKHVNPWRVMKGLGSKTTLLGKADSASLNLASADVGK